MAGPLYPVTIMGIPELSRHPGTITSIPEPSRHRGTAGAAISCTVSCVGVRGVRRFVSLAAATAALTIMVPGGPSEAQTTRPRAGAAEADAHPARRPGQSALQRDHVLGQQYDASPSSSAAPKPRSSSRRRPRAGTQAASQQPARRGATRRGQLHEQRPGPDPADVRRGDPELFLSQASIVTELNNQAGMR